MFNYNKFRWLIGTPAVPKLYWDVYSDEQRVKSLWANLDALIKWMNRNMKKIHDALVAFKLEVEAEINRFEEYMLEEWEAYKAEMEAAWEEFKAKLEAEWAAFKAELEAEWAAFKAEIEATIESLKEEWAAFQQKLEEEWAEFKAEIEATIESLKEEWAAFQQELEEEWAEFKSDIESTIETLESEWAAFQQELEEEWAEFKSSIESTIESLKEEWATFKSDLEAEWAAYKEALNKEWAEFKATVDSALDALQSALDSLSDALDSLTTRVETNEQDIDTLQECCESVQSRLDTDEQNIDTLQECCESVQSRLDADEQELEDHEERIIYLEENSGSGGSTTEDVYLENVVYTTKNNGYYLVRFSTAAKDLINSIPDGAEGWIEFKEEIQPQEDGNSVGFQPFVYTKRHKLTALEKSYIILSVSYTTCLPDGVIIGSIKTGTESSIGPQLSLISQQLTYNGSSDQLIMQFSSIQTIFTNTHSIETGLGENTTIRAATISFGYTITA